MSGGIDDSNVAAPRKIKWHRTLRSRAADLCSARLPAKSLQAQLRMGKAVRPTSCVRQRGPVQRGVPQIRWVLVRLRRPHCERLQPPGWHSVHNAVGLVALVAFGGVPRHAA